MSAVAIGVCGDGIIVASDGVSYDYETGNVGSYVSKVVLMPEHGCFIASTGMGGFGVAMRWEVDQHINSFDDFVDSFETLAEAVHRRVCLAHYGSVHAPEAEVSSVIGGWSDKRQRYEAWRLTSYEKPSVRLEGGKRVNYQLNPFVKEALPAAIWCSHLPEQIADFDVAPPPPGMETAEILARLICACRAGSGFVESENGEPGRHYNVGGFLQMTIVQRDHVQSWIAHRWHEDEVGLPVDPTKGERVVSWQLAA